MSANRRYAVSLLILLATTPIVRAAEPVKLADVRITGGLWAERQATCRRVTLPYCFDACEETKRIDNFAKAAGRLPGKFEGLWFNDSDVYKVLQGAAYPLAGNDDAQLAKRADDVIALIAAAQQPDGYLDTYFTIDRREERFKHIHPNAKHELYCMGHLIEAGAVHFEMTGRRNLLDVAVRLADHLDSIFGPGRRHEVPEHQELELALIKLYRVTDEPRYLRLAQFFIDQRGNAAGHTLYGSYSQDHLPVRQQHEAVGHAVRAMYNCIGMADLYQETGDKRLLTACRALWKNTTQCKMYVTGGVGATSRGEAFGANYDLPNETAYAETCAQIGLTLFAHRMWQIDPDAQYIDVMERVLYNSFLSGLSLSGDRFYYRNRLATNGDYVRQPWYGCACCPSNVVRIYPIVGTFAYGQDRAAAYVNLYIDSTAKLTLGDRPVTLTQKTDYPWDGRVRLTVDVPEPQAFDLCLRIPGWCKDDATPGQLYRAVSTQESSQPITLRINSQTVELGTLDRGYVRLRREWKSGDVVELNLPMPIRRVYSHPNVQACAGRVALQRGPIVYCVEGIDHGGSVQELILPRETNLTAQHQDDLLGGATIIQGKAQARTADGSEQTPVDLRAIPYYTFDNRGASPMAVWLSEEPH